MNNIDQKIQNALRREAAGNTPLPEPSLAEETLLVFRGRNRLISILMSAANFVFFIGAVWAALRFYRAESVTLQLQWGAMAFLLLVISLFVKLWFWLEMHSNRVLRELKRVELLVHARPPQS